MSVLDTAKERAGRSHRATVNKYLFLIFSMNVSHIAAAFFLTETIARRCMYEISNSFAGPEERSQLLHKFQVMNERVRKRVPEEQYANVEEHGLRQEFLLFLDQIRQGAFVKVLKMLDAYPLFTHCFRSIENESRGHGLHSSDATALHCAVRYGQCAIALELIIRGSGVNNSDHEGRTALHSAVLCQQKRLTPFLLVRGACVCKPDAYDKDALTYAMEREEMALTRIMLDHMLHNGGHDEVVNLIVPHIILRSRRVPAYKEYFYFLVNHPLFDCDVQNKAGSMPIHITVAFDCADAFMILLNTGAWCDAQNHAGRSALMEAVRYYRLTRRGRYIIEKLLFISSLSIEDNKNITAHQYLELLGFEGLEFLEEKRKYESQCTAALNAVTSDVPEELHQLVCKMVFGHSVQQRDGAGWWEVFKRLVQRDA